MFQFIGHFLWHSLIGWVGITGLILIASAAAAFYATALAGYMPAFAPLASIIRHIALIVATICVCILFLYPKAYLDGENHIRAKWQAAEARAIQDGDKARADAIKRAASDVKDNYDVDGD